MSVAQSVPLSAEWKERLDLSRRAARGLYEEVDAVERCPHAGAIRMALEDVGASAVFCVQDVPTVVILAAAEYDPDVVAAVHGALWNQGLASLLLVLAGDAIRAFSLDRKAAREDEDFDDRCLVRKLDAVADALDVKDLLYGAESGRLWDQYPDYFDARERVDQVLLDNLMVSHGGLCGAGLSAEAAQALLIQTMFIAYLEDRQIVLPEYFKKATDGAADSLVALLESKRVVALYRLFECLREDFNGDLFVAPCAFHPKEPRPRVTRKHMGMLANFRRGREEMGRGGGQLRFWGYDFKYIPIELVSAVYDRFLGLRASERKKKGAYYTPMFLADTVMMAVWETLTARAKVRGTFVDPACGSGIFMVRCFQQLCEHWRERHGSRKIRWGSLCSILGRLRGCDVNDGAVRVAVFSLYVALLQEVKPPDIRKLIGRGRLLPALWGKSLRAEDFFDVEPERMPGDVVIGNPPWASRRFASEASVAWCKERGLPMPEKEEAWAFVWKSLQHLRDGGVVGFLVPAMGFLHNHGGKAIEARRRLIADARVYRMVNFADLRFQLFEGAVRPAALIVVGDRDGEARDYRFDYWAPKADMNLKNRRVITLATADKGVVASRETEEDPFVFKHRLWMNGADARLFGYLARMPKIGDVVRAYGTLVRRRKSFEDGWVVGHGFKPASEERLDDEEYEREQSDLVANSPYMPIEVFRALAQCPGQPSSFEDGLVHRKGFERGFSGLRILVPRGIAAGQRRLRASFVEAPLTFEDIIQAICIPPEDVRRAKVLTALLNSKLMLWFAFHGTASFGSERPEIQQGELLRLPFPRPGDIEDVQRSEEAAEALVSIVDDAMASVAEDPLLLADEGAVFEELDGHCYSYFGLGEEEVALVEDGVDFVIPSAQPRSTMSPDTWKPASRNDREAYATSLVGSLSQWFDEDCGISAMLEAKNSDLGLLHLRIGEGSGLEYREREGRGVGEALGALGDKLDIPLPGNFQLVPDFRLFDGKSLYLVKPLQRRFWLRSTGIADADRLAVELQHALQFSEVGDAG